MSVFSSKQRVAVFRGGSAETLSLSMQHGDVVLERLQGLGFETIDVMVTPKREWLVGGRKTIPTQLLMHTDIAYNAVLGMLGEDGSLARTLTSHGIPYQSANPFASLCTWRKDLAHMTLKKQGIPTPPYMVVHPTDIEDLHRIAHRISDMFGPTYVVKPLASGQRDSVYFSDGLSNLPVRMAQVFAVHDTVMVEKHIDGQSVTVTAVPNLRSSALYQTPVLAWQHRFDEFGVLLKDEDLTSARLSKEERKKIHELVQRIYKTLDLTGTVRFDLQVTPSGNVYFLEANTLSPFHDNSVLTQTCAAVGVSLEELLSHEIASAL